MTVTPLRPDRTHTPPPAAPVDLGALTGDELLVIFYAAAIRWHSHRFATYPQLASIAVEQINHLGLDVIQEITRQVRDAADHNQWHTYETLLPGPDAVSDARMFAHNFRIGHARAARTPAGAVSAWKHALHSRAVAS